MFKKIYLLLIALVFLSSIALFARISVQQSNKVENLITFSKDERLFTLFCAAYAAGHGEKVSFWKYLFYSPSRLQYKINEEVKNLDPEAIQKVKAYFEAHGFNEPNFVTYCLLLSNPPEFARVQPWISVGVGNVDVSISDFNKVLKQFYIEANIHSLWEKYVDYYDKEIQKLQRTAKQALQPLFNFLRIDSLKTPRQIVILPNLLQGPGSGYGELIADTSYLILGPCRKPDMKKIQHECLHPIINPLTEKYYHLVAQSKSLLPLVKNRLPFYYRTWETVVNESLIRTIVIMINSKDNEKRKNEIQKLYKNGFILSPHFLEQLQIYEKTETNFLDYFAQLFSTIDLKKENNRFYNYFKSPYRKIGKLTGPINNVHSSKTIRVYGTQSPNSKENEAIKTLTYWSVEYFNKPDEVKADTTIDQEDIRSSNLCLYGTYWGNKILARVAEILPIKVTEKVITVGNRKYTDPKTKLIMACPNPLNPKRYVLIYTGLSWETIIDIHKVSHGWTDYVVANGLQTVERGFFDKSNAKHWTVSNESRTFFDLDTNWNQYSSDHYLFYYRPNSLAERKIHKISSIQEACYNNIQKGLDFSNNVKIKYFLYESNVDKGKVIDDAGNGLAIPALKEVHAVFSERTNVLGHHEVGHVLSYQVWGNCKLECLVEGLAVFLDNSWWSHPLHQYAYELMKQKRLYPIETLFDNEFFRSKLDIITYPQMGSFVKFIIENYGIEKFKKFYLNANYENVSRLFKDIFENTIIQVEKDWLNHLHKYAGQYPYIGIDVINSDRGLMIRRVYRDSPAFKSQLVIGDIIKQFDGHEIASKNDYFDILKKKKPSSKVQFVLQDDKKVTLVTENLWDYIKRR